MNITTFDVSTSFMVTFYIVVEGKNIDYDDLYHHDRGFTMTDEEWQERTKGVLKAEIKRRGLGYKQLVDKLKEIGVYESDRNIANKLARGGFSAVFLMQVLTAIGCHTLHLDA
jgi:hypothetical protein